jgi:N-acyl homoserine lactone hydrolase
MIFGNANLRRCLSFCIFIFVAFFPSAVTAQSESKSPMPLRLYIFDCGTMDGIKAATFNMTQEELPVTKVSVPCYLIVHPKGTLIWDTGVVPDSAFKTDGAAVVQGIATATKPLLPQLRQVGYTPRDITFLALSHYHLDHAANANAFAASTWLVQKAERDAMFTTPGPRLARPADYSALKESKTIVITTSTYDVFGDGRVVIMSAPGHTPGHQVLLLKLAQTGPVIIAGDLYHYQEERRLNKIPTFEYNAEEAAASRKEIEEVARKSGAQLWIEHDFIGNSKLRKSPEFYE